MQEVTIYQGTTIPFELVYESGARDVVALPSAASVDTPFLAMWLYGKAEKTQRAYAADIHKLYAHVDKPLQDLRLDDFQDFLNSLVHLKASSRARITAAVKSALSFGLKTGYLQVNVGSVVKLPKLEDTLAERIMSEQAVAKMFALETNQRNHAILVLLYRAGLRVSELCNLTWRNLQERNEAGQITVFGKGKKTRHVLLDAATWDEVMNLRTSFDTLECYVFQSRQERSRTNKRTKRLDESTVHRIVSTAARRAGITGKVSPHWMRHAHATHALEHGAPITLVKETLGHKSIETTAKYTHVRPNASSSQFLGV
jgi:site-specific recombinase XerD